MSEIPYYLNDNLNYRNLRKAELKDILDAHNVAYGSTMTRPELFNLFKRQILVKRREIIANLNTSSIQSAGPDDNFDSDGFRIPAVPLHRRKKSGFNPEDSFASSSEEDVPHVPSAPQTVSSVNFSHIGSGAFNWISQNRDSQRQASLLSSDEDERPGPSTDPMIATASSSKPPLRFNPPALKREASMCFPTSSITNQSRQANPFLPPSLKREASFSSPQTPQVNSSRTPACEDSDESTDEHHSPRKDSRGPKKLKEQENKEDEGDDEWEEDDDSDDADDSDYNPSSDSDEDAEDFEGEADVDYQEIFFLKSDASRSVQRPKKTYQQKSLENAEKSGWFSLFHVKSCIQDAYSALRTPSIRCYFYLAVLFSSFLLSFIASFRYRNGYCSSELEEDSRLSLNSFLPSLCIPCPYDGWCEYGELSCIGVLVRKRPFYNPKGIFPISDICEYSAETFRKMHKIERVSKKILYEKQGRLVYESYRANPSTPRISPLHIAHTNLNDFLDYIETAVAEVATGEEATEIFSAVRKTIVESRDVFVWKRKNNVETIGTITAILPTRYYALKLYRFFYTTSGCIVLLAAFLSAAAFAVVKFVTRCRIYNKKVELLMKRVVDELGLQYQNHVRYSNSYPSPNLPVAALRSSVIDIHDDQSFQVWKRVVWAMSSYPNVRTSIEEFMGEPVECWGLISDIYELPRLSFVQRILNAL